MPISQRPNEPLRVLTNQNRLARLVCVQAFLGLVAVVTACSSQADTVEVKNKVATLFKARCVKCHGPVEPKGDLDLSTFAAIARGIAGEPVVHPNKLEESTIWERIAEGAMPPGDSGDEPLSDDDKSIVRNWIESGAPGLTTSDEEQSAHWAFQPVTEPTVPSVTGSSTARNEIDHFILQRLESKNLSLAAEADRATLIRRVCFDLTGLPPTPIEIATFVTDPATDAYERMVDRYLASSRYGERWGKYWLDAAGYADSNGYFNADSARPLAYRYRDYVIGSFNADKPIDQFVREQIAGDELAGYVRGGDVTPEMVELLTATHYLRNSQDGTGESDGNPDEVLADRMTVLEGTLHITMSSLLGVTIQCARCHSHKFEPIRHDEYYRLQAIFYPAYCPDRWSKPNDRKVEIGTKEAREAQKHKAEQVTVQIAALRSSLEAVASPLRDQFREERVAKLDGQERADALKAWKTPEKERSDEQKQLIKKHIALLDIPDDTLAERFGDFAALRKQIEASVAEREKERPAPLEEIAVVLDAPGEPPKHHRLERGLYKSHAEEVEPGVPAAFTPSSNEYQVPLWKEGITSTGRRTEFARWVTSRDNPLFGRVFVNRIWKDHFGTGIVATTENLGLSGAPPSHPELLDYLVAGFVHDGFSAKSLHRKILCSATYRQASAPTEPGLTTDPENRLLWRFPPRRLDAEAVRDSMLAVSGELDLRKGGPPIQVSRAADGSVVVPEDASGAHRRSIYLRQRRTEGLTMLELFDAPVMVINCTARNPSTVPLQSLALLNSDFALARARGFAKRLQTEADTDDGRVTLGFLLVAGRGPTTQERVATTEFLDSQNKLYAGQENATGQVWTNLCQMLLSSSAFLYVE